MNWPSESSESILGADSMSDVDRELARVFRKSALFGDFSKGLSGLEEDEIFLIISSFGEQGSEELSE